MKGLAMRKETMRAVVFAAASLLAFEAQALTERKGDYDRAIADFNKAIELDPKDAIAYGGRGFAYSSKADYDRAIADLTKAIELDPKNARIYYYNRGKAYERKGGYDGAKPQP
jgi:tetratricopeptide (TPR) repeat protein